jgi:oxygen-independent coproporphyrinogen-3 oxidase
VAHDRLPLARWLHLGRWGGAAYETFWQAYAGRIDLCALDGAYGASTTEVARAFLVPLAAAGLARRVPGGYRITPRGFDVYHDLERLVTYGLIEPLWGEMLAEHRTAAASGGRASWAVPTRARAGAAWRLVRCVTERPVPNETRG